MTKKQPQILGICSLIARLIKLSVFGRDGVDNAFNLIGISDDPFSMQIVELSKVALNAYFIKDFTNTIEVFSELSSLNPVSDWPEIMSLRCQEFLTMPHQKIGMALTGSVLSNSSEL